MENAVAVWAKHKLEILEGKVGPAVHLRDAGLEHGLLAERFGVEETETGVQRCA